VKQVPKSISSAAPHESQNRLIIKESHLSLVVKKCLRRTKKDFRNNRKIGWFYDPKLL